MGYDYKWRKILKDISGNILMIGDKIAVPYINGKCAGLKLVTINWLANKTISYYDNEKSNYIAPNKVVKIIG